MQKKSSCHQTPTIRSLQHWLIDLWQTFYLQPTAKQTLNTRPPYLLNAIEQQALFFHIAQSYQATHPLMSVSETARQCCSSWNTLQKWGIPWKAFAEQHDASNIAYQVMRDYRNHMLTQYTIDESQLITWLTQQDLNQHSFPQTIVLLGFDDSPTPIERLFEKLRTRCTITQPEQTIHTPPPQPHYRCSADPDADLIHMAKWAKTRWMETPNQSIACIVPQLSQCAHRVKTIFHQVFQTSCAPTSTEELPYNISYGQPLAEYPMITHALQSLSFPHDPPTFDRLRLWLRAPFLIAADTACLARCDLEKNLRTYDPATLSLQKLQSILQSNDQPLSSALERYTTLLEQEAKHAKPSTFATYFNDRLKALGWPGPQPLDSTAYQLHQKWQALLFTFARFDTMLPLLSTRDALSLLNHLAHQTLFQPQTHWKPIQVLGILEAAALPFDALRVCHLDDEHWPAPAQPNTIIPMALQRQYKLPHTTPERHLAFYQRLTHRFMSNAPHVILSYPIQQAERALKPSPLLENASETVVQETESTRLIFPSSPQATLEPFVDTHGPAHHTQTPINGGSYALQAVAACPFKAFAHFRLHARTPPSMDYFINPMHRGQLIHDALQSVWQQLRDHQTLCDAFATDQLPTYIEKAVTQAITRLKQQMPQYSNTLQLKATRAHLIQQLMQYAMQESKRAPFKVLAMEQKKHTHIAGLPISLRMDRVDQRQDGKIVIIDYKTSAHFSIKSWFGPTLKQPQMPLYALSYGKMQSIAAIGIIELSAEQIRWKGLQCEDDMLPGAKTLKNLRYTDAHIPPNTWEDLSPYWGKRLEALVSTLRCGDASVTPIDATTCKQCDLHLLCRIT